MIDRRQFLQKAALGSAALVHLPTIQALPVNKRHVGIQIYAHNLLDEGIERCLDGLQERAAVDTLYLTSHTYYCASNRPPAILADHGIPILDERKRRLPKVWLKSHDEFYRNTRLRHQLNPGDFEYGERDIFKEILQPLRKRGMKLYARWYEPTDINRVMVDGKPSIRNWEEVLVVDMDGERGRSPCWNHPDYREWLRASVQDMFTNYELDGIQFGAERTGPLSEQLFQNGKPPSCFCRHCMERNSKHGLDGNRARRGYRELYGLMAGVRQGSRPVDGVVTSVLRLFQQYSEILGWNYQWLQADHEIQKMIYDTVKSIHSGAEVVRHIDHQRSSWDIFYRAAAPYSEMEGTCDWIKPILYHEIFGPRLLHWKIEQEHQTTTSELTLEQSLELFYSLFHYDKEIFPSLDQLDKGIPPEYVYVETRRAVEATKGNIPVASGIGIDIPWNGKPFPSHPESIYKATQLAFQAGARGVVASREYDEMQFQNLEAFGDAIRDESKSSSTTD